jgi:hypothetical protein
MISKNSQTNCFLFSLHFLITLSINKNAPPPWVNQSQGSVSFMYSYLYICLGWSKMNFPKLETKFFYIGCAISQSHIKKHQPPAHLSLTQLKQKYTKLSFTLTRHWTVTYHTWCAMSEVSIIIKYDNSLINQNAFMMTCSCKGNNSCIQLICLMISSIRVELHLLKLFF